MKVMKSQDFLVEVERTRSALCRETRVLKHPSYSKNAFKKSSENSEQCPVMLRNSNLKRLKDSCNLRTIKSNFSLCSPPDESKNESPRALLGRPKKSCSSSIRLENSMLTAIKLKQQDFELM